ncbi:pyrroline-5-carboxylate reductase [Sphingobium fontiphilum]|uniref:Pyrroline-5-carboxylate reductase n=1 Tax=Sphingobium fontiphilum TaxID=944425 RepID=A0A7W6DEI2_9SPHN|nr:pyrroline-5-carboxylate reductase [Sphingobium fontiphilum]MBB3981775.1 pyrroline-5-carboxylate reductase [Sphingobium fontiphilum]
MTQTVTAWPERLLMVGCGNMAGQMLARWLACGLPPENVTVVRPSGRAVAPGVTVLADMPAALTHGATILLGMKPYQLGDVAPRLAPLCDADTRILSILAGTPLAALRAQFPQVDAVIEAMPNLPVGIGEGVVGLYTDGRTEATARAAAEALMAPLGLAEWIADESLFNALTALSGCGPAFLFRFIDTLARAGEALGLPVDQAARMAIATVRGAASMAARSGDSPARLADQVASPGGMTREGLNVMDADDRMARLMADTLRAARDRGDAMARGG